MGRKKGFKMTDAHKAALKAGRERARSECVNSTVEKEIELPKTKKNTEEIFGVYIQATCEEDFRKLMRSSHRWQDKAYAQGVCDTLSWILGDTPNVPIGKEVEETNEQDAAGMAQGIPQQPEGVS